MAATPPTPGELTPSAELLQWVPGWSPAEPPQRIERLPGGSVNRVWRVDTRRGCFVLRVDGPVAQRPGVNRRREQRLHRAAADAGLAPRIVASSPALDVMVSEFQPGRHWGEADYRDVGQLRRLGACLGELHRLPPPRGRMPAFDPLAIARLYAGSRGVQRARVTPLVARLLQRVRRSMVLLARSGRAPVIVHGDPVHGNLLDTGTRLWLIDFEYAQLADPIFDIAAVVAYYPVARPFAPELLLAAGLDGAGVLPQLAAAIGVHEALGLLWHYARGEALTQLREAAVTADSGFSGTMTAH